MRLLWIKIKVAVAIGLIHTPLFSISAINQWIGRVFWIEAVEKTLAKR